MTGAILTLVWAVLDHASRGWRGLTMTSGGLRLLHDLLDPPRQLRPRTVTAVAAGCWPARCRGDRHPCGHVDPDYGFMFPFGGESLGVFARALAYPVEGVEGNAAPRPGWVMRSGSA